MFSSPRPFVRGAALLATAALTLAACSGGDDPVSDPALPSAGKSEAGDVDSAGSQELAADLAGALATATPLDGASSFDAASLTGQHAVVWFWAPWCTICRSEAPEVAEVAERYASEVQIIGVPGRGGLDEMTDFVSDTGTGSLPHLADLDGQVWSAFGVFGQPAFAFIDDDGSVDVFVGGLGGEALAERIDALIAA
ncbi:MAG TPA: redoxin domain-containing protein [Ilumatobacteraceae bacterium]|nr:redoxin domain-containing protein [Ilumatobacteraceae bacterium]